VMIAAVLMVLFGCGNVKTVEPLPGAEKQRKIDQLRSLPYLGGTTSRKDESTGVVFFDRERTCRGCRLYTVQMLSRAELITVEGKVLWKWHYPGNDRWERAELLPGGDLLVVGIEHFGRKDGRAKRGIPDSARYAMRLDWSGRLLWKRKFPAHHDIELTPDGRILVLSFQRRLVPDIHSTIPTRDDCITLLEQDGTVVKSRSMLDAIRKAPEVFPLQPVKPSGLGRLPWVDLFHANSIEWMHHDSLFSKHDIYAPNNVLVCFRHQDRIAIINWPENRVVWSWGQEQTSGPHDARVLENGHILLFDNGLGRGWSRAIEVDPLTGKIVWEYRNDPPSRFYTASKGSGQRLPNGNTLLAESDRGRAIEVTPGGDVVWRFVCPYRLGDGKRAAIVRMIWHSRDFIDRLMTLRNTVR
ncbi:MAG: aryl-sulfate sulfotransferase, partial [Candidatus Aminicenantes bacterium]